MGFHPDFTGRQNVQMAGQLLGLSADELARAMPQIERFAEIGRYIDEPLRTYSSGMQMRLAFSLATAVRPDVLIIDEALAVGDLAFQHKCYARLREFRQAGTTLLFVSHDPGAVKSLCERALLLDGGRVVADDAPDQVLDAYNALVARQENAALSAQDALGRGRADGGRGVRVTGARNCWRWRWRMARGSARAAGGEAMRLRVRAVKHAPVPDLTLGFLVRDRLGNEVFGTNTWHVPLPGLNTLAVGVPFTVVWDVPALYAGPGGYSVSVALHGDMTHLNDNYDWWDKAVHFEVVRGGGPLFEGVCYWPQVHPRLVDVEDGVQP